MNNDGLTNNSDLIDPRVAQVADVLLRACEGPSAMLRPWRPFDTHRVAQEIVDALDEQATRLAREDADATA